MKSNSIIVSFLNLLILIFLISGCMRATEPDDAGVIVVTATFRPPTMVSTPSPPPALNLSPVPSSITTPTPDPTHPAQPETSNQEYVVQPGDTLYNIALANNLSLETLLAANELLNPDLLKVGQVITIPGAPAATSPHQKLLADANFVRGPSAAQFDIANFIASMPGYIRFATDTVTTALADGSQREDLLNAAQIIERVSLEYSIDPRLLLALLEYRAGWLSNPTPTETLKTHPIISAEAPTTISTNGLYRQLIWVANELNRGYYGWKYG
ncbi:MAG: LysM peptidoglycan-binding domain-containing protein, partial [Chloroflexi bacterium]